MDSQKVKIDLFRHSGLDPESSDFNMFWIPAFAGMTAMEGFYETIILTYIIQLYSVIPAKAGIQVG